MIGLSTQQSEQHKQYMTGAQNCHRSVKAIAHENTIHTIVHNPATELLHHEPALARKLNVLYCISAFARMLSVLYCISAFARMLSVLY